MIEEGSYVVYENQRNEYLFNAEKLFAEGKYRKASEMYWGAAAQTIKAVALLFDRRLNSHGHIIKFVEELSRETHDVELLKAFNSVQVFHRNFYDEQISPETMETYRMVFEEFLHKLGEIAQKRYSEIFDVQTNQRPDIGCVEQNRGRCAI